ncbi:glycosyltransferase [Microbacterium sp. 2MCAF23]|uniref:glycosyltransferase n=1 Tax=Microbacterium sp. 2MCAF23 TaxID=3232985 RepID=UPI003F9767FB
MLCLSTLREGFGQLIFEALGLGVLTITTEATDARDTIVDGEAGLIVPVQDRLALAAATGRATGDPDRVRAWGAAAWARAATHNSTGRAWRQCADHFDALIGSRS